MWLWKIERHGNLLSGAITDALEAHWALLRQCARNYPLLTLAGLNESVSDYTHKATLPTYLP